MSVNAEVLRISSLFHAHIDGACAYRCMDVATRLYVADLEIIRLMDEESAFGNIKHSCEIGRIFSNAMTVFATLAAPRMRLLFNESLPVDCSTGLPIGGRIRIEGHGKLFPIRNFYFAKPMTGEASTATVSALAKFPLRDAA